MDLLLLWTAFIAGILTILAPCILPLLPVIIGGTAGSEDRWRPLIVTGSLALSVIVFTLLLKASTFLIDIPPNVWSIISGGILILIGLFMLLPGIWAFISYKSKLDSGTGALLSKAGAEQSRLGGVLTGAALGPVFSSCSPTYFVILGVILPASLFKGIVYLLVYALGLMLVLGLIAFFGQRIVMKLGWAANPKGWFKKIMALLLIVVGLAIASGYEKKAGTAILDAGYWVTNFEEELLEKMEMDIEKSIEDALSSFDEPKEEMQIMEPMEEEEMEDMMEEIKKEEQSKSIEENKPAPQLPIRGLKTDTTKSSIDLNLVLSGGPGKDGIPAINNPKFISIDDTDIDDEVLGIFVEFDGIQRFYPYTIMVWHEIANDQIGDNHFAVTFCPLCGSAIVFDRRLDGEVVRFGVSGLLFESNLLMYDDKTESLWSQARGEAVIGDFLGTELTHLPMQLITFEELKEKYPKSQVLSKDTGHNRDYGIYPYGNYEETERLYFPVTVSDKRYHPKKIMYVITVNKQSITFPYEDIPQGRSKVENDLASFIIQRDKGEIMVYESVDSEKAIPGYFEMWFSWATQHEGGGMVMDQF